MLEPFPRVVCDIDGVLADFVGALVPLLNERYRLHLAPDDIDLYAIEEVVGVPKAEIEELLAELTNTGFYARLPMVTGAWTMSQLMALRGSVHLVTSRPPALKGETRRWLAAKRIPYQSLTFRSRSAKHLPEDRADVVIEDDRLAAVEAAAHTPRVYLLDYPYNREGEPLPSNCIRVRGWGDLFLHLTETEQNHA